jgi:hypothetical protein
MANNIIINAAIDKLMFGTYPVSKVLQGTSLIWQGVGVTLPLSYYIISGYKFQNNVLDTKAVNNGIANNLTYSSGLVGQTGVFNGSTSYVNCGNDATLKLNKGSLSLMVKTASAGSGFRSLALKSDAYGLFLSNGVLVIYDWFSAATRSTGINLNNNVWRHVVLTFDSAVTNGTKIYIDGSLVLTTTMRVKNQNLGFYIGCNVDTYGTLQHINANIDCVKVWDKILSNTEVSQIATDELNGIDINP